MITITCLRKIFYNYFIEHCESMLANTCNEGKSLKVQVLKTIFAFLFTMIISKSVRNNRIYQNGSNNCLV